MLQFGQRTIDIANRMNWPLDAVHMEELVRKERIRPKARVAENAFAAARTQQLKAGYEETGYCDWVERKRQATACGVSSMPPIKRDYLPNAKKYLEVIREVQQLEYLLKKKKTELALYSQASDAHD